MRILIAHSYYRISGGEDRYVDQQIELLSSRHEVASIKRSNDELGSAVRTASRMLYSPKQRSEIEREIKAFDPDVVHVHNVYPAFGPAVHLAAKNLGIPLVMTVHNFRLRCPNGFMFTEGEPCRRCESGNYLNGMVHHCFPSASQAVAYTTGLWMHRWLMRLERNVDLFIAPSRFMATRLREWGMKERRIVVVPNFTEEGLGDATPGSFGLNVGRHSPEKGLGDLLHALKTAGDPPFVFVGDGPATAELEKLAQDLGLVNVEFRGRVRPSDVGSLMRQARFVVIPSIWDENAPLAALEAMAAGRPLLVTEMGGLPELVGGGEGLSCPPSDISALTEALTRLMREDELCREAGERAASRARAEFSPTAHLAALEGAYRSVLEGEA